jgi:uncharacterized membrane protein
MRPKMHNRFSVKLWIIIIALLAISNVAYLIHDFIGWAITLSFFCFTPGLLVINKLIVGKHSTWERIGYALPISLLMLMIDGLIVNSLHAFGSSRPLTTFNIFVVLDASVLLLTLLDRQASIKIHSLSSYLSKIKAEHLLVCIALTTLPLLSVFGAFSLNNGGSNVWTLVSLFLAAGLMAFLLYRKKLSSIYPYAILAVGLSVLLSTSLRGWFITGHDIQHEFYVFQNVSKNSYWNPSKPLGDPYNACLSITILPTILDRITGIYAPYIYKVIFQILFAVGILPIYFIAKKFFGQFKAVVSTIIFISFPTFINDITFLNRQEIAFIFFGILIQVNLSSIPVRAKRLITILMLLGLAISHYSSCYVAIALLAITLFIMSLISKKRNIKNLKTRIPLLSVPILFCILLFTFFWNAQITSSTAGLKNTISTTFDQLWSSSSTQASGVSYSILPSKAEPPVKVLSKYAGTKSDKVYYSVPANLPLSRLGNWLNKFFSVSSLNSVIRGLSAKILQVLLIIGLIIFIRQRNKSTEETFLLVLGIASLTLLIMITLLPELSEDYSVTRLFQQTLVITAPIIVFALSSILKFTKKLRPYIVGFVFLFMFLDLSGFIPQVLGGYPPQLSLNNSGTYYNLYYVQKGELIAGSWLTQNADQKNTVAADSYAAIRLPNYPFYKLTVVNPIFAKRGAYLFEDYSNLNDSYAVFIDGDVVQYTYVSPLTQQNLLYNDNISKVYGQ